jgi:hypothetical protein
MNTWPPATVLKIACSVLQAAGLTLAGIGAMGSVFNPKEIGIGILIGGFFSLLAHNLSQTVGVSDEEAIGVSALAQKTAVATATQGAAQVQQLHADAAKAGYVVVPAGRPSAPVSPAATAAPAANPHQALQPLVVVGAPAAAPAHPDPPYMA